MRVKQRVWGMGAIAALFAALLLGLWFGSGGQAQVPTPDPGSNPTANPVPANAGFSQSPSPIASAATDNYQYLPANPAAVNSSPVNSSAVDNLKGGAAPVAPIRTLPPAPPLVQKPLPLPLSSTYRDAAGRFQVGILQGYSVSPLADGVLVEAPTGNLAYTALLRPVIDPQGLAEPGLALPILVQTAQQTFQRGEAFQTGSVQVEPDGAAQIPWTGTLTIGGKAQPVQGKILARASPKGALLLLVIATQGAVEQVDGAIAALSTTLQAL